MEKKVLANPFVVGRYVSAEYFCDRQEETELLIKQIENGRNVALISPRRMGKTGLIWHSFAQPELATPYTTIFVDIYATTSLAEFVYVLGKTILDQLRSKADVLKDRFFQIVRSLNVGMTIDSTTGIPSFSLGLGNITAPETTLNEIFRYLETSSMPCVVAIDEFQQITTYPEKNTEALLRTHIQQCRQTQFVFAGSKRHLMNQMFNSSAKPFYQSSITLSLNPIARDVYTEFAIKLFEKYGKKIDAEVVHEVYDRFCGTTWFMQMMMNELFAITPKDGEACTIEMFAVAWRNVIAIQDANYRDQLAQLPPRQKMLLQAIAKDGVANALTSADFINRHSLLSASSVQSALKSLLANDIVTLDDAGYRIYDYFYADWLRHNL